MGPGLVQFRDLFVFLRYYLGPSQVVTVGVTVLCVCRIYLDGGCCQFVSQHDTQPVHNLS